MQYISYVHAAPWIRLFRHQPRSALGAPWARRRARKARGTGFRGWLSSGGGWGQPEPELSNVVRCAVGRNKLLTILQLISRVDVLGVARVQGTGETEEAGGGVLALARMVDSEPIHVDHGSITLHGGEEDVLQHDGQLPLHLRGWGARLAVATCICTTTSRPGPGAKGSSRIPEARSPTHLDRQRVGCGVAAGRTRHRGACR